MAIVWVWRRLTPDAFDQHKPVTVVFPTRCYVDGMAPRRKLPTAGRPNVPTFMPIPMAPNPDVMARGAFDDDFMQGGRRWFGNKHLRCG